MCTVDMGYIIKLSIVTDAYILQSSLQQLGELLRGEIVNAANRRHYRRKHKGRVKEGTSYLKSIASGTCSPVNY